MGEKCILIVDDRSDVRRAVKYFLKPFKRDIFGFATPSGIHPCFDFEQVAVAIIDLCNSSSSGVILEFIKKVHSKGIPIIIYTGAIWKTGVLGEELGDEKGITIVEKPSGPNLERLTREVEKILSKEDAAQREEQPPLSKEYLEQLFGYTAHIDSPYGKWIKSEISNPSLEFELHIMQMELKKQLREPAATGEYSKRELNEMMGKYLILEKRQEQARRGISSCVPVTDRTAPTKRQLLQ